MTGNVLDYLENSARRVPERAAYTDERQTITYRELESLSKAVGTALSQKVLPRTPVAVLMDARDARCVAAFLGILYAGCFYVPLDPAMPKERLELILRGLEPALILYDEKCAPRVAGLPYDTMRYAQAIACERDQSVLDAIRAQTSVYDLLTVLYTSGSTGIPKGVSQSQYSFITYTEATNEVYGFTEDTVFGNQSPFFYANSIIDIYPPIALGASVYLLPANALSFPQKFIDCLNAHKVTELTMTPSSYVQVANSGALTPNALPSLRYVIMSGEVTPWKQISLWMEASPNAGFYNFYGSTELFSVAVHRIDQPYSDGEIIPVGPPYRHVHILFVGEDGREVPRGEAGEMFIANPWLSSGYYKDKRRTDAAFVCDPMERGYHERFYQTGDMGRLNEKGQLVVLGRKDTQIKHMGYRMELGEVEAALQAIPGWQDGLCLYDKESGLIYCFWEGALTRQDITVALRTKLQKYMLPDRYIHFDVLPHTSNMKIDRVKLMECFQDDENEAHRNS